MDEQIVHAHRDEVDADGLVTAGEEGDLELAADPVGGRDEDGLLVAARQPDEGGEASDAGEDLGAGGRAREGRDPANCVVAGLDVDAGLAVGERFHLSRRRAGAAASSRARSPRGSCR